MATNKSNDFSADRYKVGNLDRALTESGQGDLVFRDKFVPQSINLKDLAGSDLSTKADKVENATEDNIATLQDNGNYGDSGVSINDIVTLTDISTLSNAITSLEQLNELTGEPSGFPNRTDSSLSFVIGTRTLTIQGSPTFEVYFNGIPYIKTSDSITVPDTTAVTFVYYEEVSGALQLTSSTTAWDLSIHSPVALVYWDAVKGDGFDTEERHGLVMDWATHLRLHSVEGAQIEQGDFILENYLLNSGDTLTDIQPTITSGTIHDEDIAESYSPSINTNYSILTRSGTSWSIDRGQTVPFLYNADATGRLNSTSIQVAETGFRAK